MVAEQQNLPSGETDYGISRVTCKIPVRARVRVKQLLLVRAQTYAQIAKDELVGLTEKQVSQLCQRSGWHHQRRKLDAQERELAARAINAQLTEVREAIATESEELVMGGLDLAREAITNKDTRSYAQAAQGVRSLATVARECRKADSELAGSGASTSINLFFMSKPSPQIAGPKEAPAVEV